MNKCLICNKKIKFIDLLLSCNYCKDNNIGSYCTLHNHKETHSCPDLNIKKKIELEKIEPSKIVKI